MSPPWAIWVSMSGRTLAASTPAHFSLRRHEAAVLGRLGLGLGGRRCRRRSSSSDLIAGISAVLGELLLEAGRHHDLEQIVGQLLVLAVRSGCRCSSRRGRPERSCRPSAPGMANTPMFALHLRAAVVLVDDLARLPARRRHHADLAGAERQLVVGVVGVGRRGVGPVEEVLEELQPGDRLGRVELADPLRHPPGWRCRRRAPRRTTSPRASSGRAGRCPRSSGRRRCPP